MSISSLQATPASEPTFIDKKDREKFDCPLCHGIIKLALQTACGHRFCESCLKTYLQDGQDKPCPVGEAECEMLSKQPGTINPDYSARREILNLKVFCDFKDFGCKKTMPWKQLEEHAKSCPHKRIPCPNLEYSCLAQLLEGDLQHHLQEECQERVFNCNFCHATMRFSLIRDHQINDCSEIEIECPHCKAYFDTITLQGAEGIVVPHMKRRELPQHLEVCRHRPKSCKFRSAGCTFEGLEEAVKQHERESLEQHLDLVTVNFSSMEMESMELRRSLQEMRTQRDILSSQVKTQIEKNEALQKQIEKFMNSNKESQIRIVTLTERVITLERKLDDYAKKDDLLRCSTEVDTIQETMMMYEQRLSRLETGTRSERTQRNVHVGLGGLSDAVPAEIAGQLARHEQQLGIQDVRLAEMDIRFQILETATYDGVLIWKIRDLKRRKQEAVSGKTISLYSQPFYTKRIGYKMCARVYLNGDGMGKGSHMSLFFVVMRGEYDALLPWPFKHRVTMMLLDQETDRHHLSDTFRPDQASSSFRRPTTEMNIASGCPLFVAQSVLETGPYVKEDTIFIKFVVDDPDATPLPPPVGKTM